MDCALGPWVQRLWLLERTGDDASSALREVCRFTSAIAVLSNDAIHVLILRSVEVQGTSPIQWSDSGLRCDLSRNAMRFTTLDGALEWADAMKREWLRRDWLEIESDEVSTSSHA